MQSPPKLLAYLSLAIGAPLVWLFPVPRPWLDAGLSPLVAILLYQVVRRWTNHRGAVSSVCLYALFLVTSITLLNAVPGAIATRNLAPSGSAQLLVALGALLLLESGTLSALSWSVLTVLASDFHPQFVFVPLLMMTLLEAETVLVYGFTDLARGGALRCAGLCFVTAMISRELHIGGLKDDSFTLPIAWWISSWLLRGEPFISPLVRGILAAILCVSTVIEFRPWPAMGVVLLAGWLAARPLPAPKPTLVTACSAAPE